MIRSVVTVDSDLERLREYSQELVDSYLADSDRLRGRFEVAAMERYRLDRLSHPTKLISGAMEPAQSIGSRGWYFDEERASRGVTFFPVALRHTTDVWAGEPFHLSPWQAFIIWQLHGWRDIGTRLRRFRKLYCCVGRKNGKSTLASGLAVQFTFCDYPFVRKGEVYCAATKQEQATRIWRDTVLMVKQSPGMRELCNITGEKNVKSGGTLLVTDGPQCDTTFLPLGGDGETQDALNPTLVIKDELHAWRDKSLDEKLSSGGGSRQHPLEAAFTTAGDEDSNIWKAEHEFCKKVVEAGSRGHVVDDTVLAISYEVDTEDDPLELEAMKKANPSVGESLHENYLRTQITEAHAKPSERNKVVRYHANRMVGSFDQAYPEELWVRGDLTFPEPKKGDLCFIGIDLGRSNDWAAWSAIFPQVGIDDEGKPQWRYKIKTKAYCCKGVNVDVDYMQPPYSLWIQDGQLGYQTDEVLDTSSLKADILAMRTEFTVKSVPYDDSFAKEFALDLFNTYGIPVFNFFQTPLRYNEPLTSFEKALIQGRVDHGNNPVLNFQAGNCQYHYDSKGRKMLDKGNMQRWKKIDGMVAMIMAFSEAIYYAKNAPPPVYNRRGVLTI